MEIYLKLGFLCRINSVKLIENNPSIRYVFKEISNDIHMRPLRFNRQKILSAWIKCEEREICRYISSFLRKMRAQRKIIFKHQITYSKLLEIIH